MIKSVYKVLFLFTVVTLGWCRQASATHIRAGEIIAERISSATRTYRFSVIGYTDTGSDVVFGGGDIDFGDGVVKNLAEEAESNFTILLEDQVAYNVFTITHTYQGNGRYVIRYTEQNRNAGVVNMSNSVDTPFYIETSLYIDPIFGINNTPVFLVPPVDKGAVGATFLHNPGAYDPDGDSLSYHITIPKQRFDRDVNDYKDPNDPSFYTNYLEGNQERDGPPTFKIDSITGTLEWDAPGLMGEYNVAFVVKEWRQLEGEWFELGSVVRDMQIIIEETDNNPPEIIQPEELCVEAGEKISEVIVATDPDGHDVQLEAFGGPLEFLVSPATFSPDPPTIQSIPAELLFEWQTDCAHIRDRPYEIQLKARDEPPLGARLVDFKTWIIRVVAPAPTGLTATKLSGRRVQLDWDPYTCGSANQMEIWRRVDSYDFLAEDCVVGMPANAGYELIDVVNNSNVNGDRVTTYIDDNEGLGLAPGANYCYRIVAQFPQSTGGGESYASLEACAQIGVEAPVVLNVDITETADSEGEIYVRWEEPFDLNPVLFPGPYTYDVVRFEGLSGLASGDTVAFKISDLEFTDTGLNTVALPYHYLIHAYQNDGTYIDSSFPASSVRLDAQSAVKNITLTWQAQVPWSNVMGEQPYHRIWRDNVDDFFPDDLYLIDSAKVDESGFMYVDDGSHNGVELSDEIIYRYYVETKGSYGNPLFETYDPLLNKSQILSAQPNDTIPPCTPVDFVFDDSFDCESVRERGCGFDDFYNALTWSQDASSNCDLDISSYNIYFSDSDLDEELPLLTNVTGTQFTHEGLTSFKGCYQIAAVDRSGNESERSARICRDNCPYIKMPNAFTPNGDGKNDFFTPFWDDVVSGEEGEGVGIPGFSNLDCPRFVLDVNFVVFDRTGGILFSYNSATVDPEDSQGILINWDGKTNGGIELESGVYYYSLEVTFDTLYPKDSKKNYKGWVNILK